MRLVHGWRIRPEVLGGSLRRTGGRAVDGRKEDTVHGSSMDGATASVVRGWRTAKGVDNAGARSGWRG